MPDTPGGARSSPKLLRCLTCGKTVECTDEELLAYVGHVWPECCGTTMALFTETSPTDLWRLTPPPTD